MVGVQVSEPAYQCFDIRWRHKDTTAPQIQWGGYNGFPKSQHSYMVYHATASMAMVKDFLNEIFLPDDPNNTIYSQTTLTTTEIQACISPFTAIFEKSSLGFTQWCSRNKVKSCEAEKKRKRLKKKASYIACSA